MEPSHLGTYDQKYDDGPELAPQRTDPRVAPEVVVVSDEQYYLQLDKRVMSDQPRSISPSGTVVDKQFGPKREAKSSGSPELDTSHTSKPAERGGFFRSRRNRWVVVGIIIMLVIAIGLGAGLGLGLRHQTQTSQNASDPTVPPSSSPTTTPDTCTDGIRYCGWSLIEAMGYTQTYLSDTGSLDPYNDLFQCGTGNALSLNQSCGGPYHCQPPEFEKNGCSKSTRQSCCGQTCPIQTENKLGVYKAVDPSIYSDVYPEAPDPRIREIADLMTEWYNLFIDMRYIQAEKVVFPPHKHLKIDTTKPAAYGFTKDVVDLWQMLPYHIGNTQWNFGSDGGEFLMWGEFLDDLRGPDVDWWQTTVDPFDGIDDLSPRFEPGVRSEDGETRDWNDESGPYMRLWYAALTHVGNHGSVMVLDTRNYRMWFIEQLGGTSDPVLQGNDFARPETTNLNDLSQYPSRPAAEFLRDMISRFRSLEWIPGGMYDADENLGDDEEDRYTNYKELYKECGWPDKFKPILFDELRFQGGQKFDYHEPSPKPTDREKSYAPLQQLLNPMLQAREIVQQTIHLVDANYRLKHNVIADKWERQRLEEQILGTERTLQPMKSWEQDQAKLRIELAFKTSDLEALRTRTGRYAGPGWAGASDAEIRELYQQAAADSRIDTVRALLDDENAEKRAEREYREAKQAAKVTPQAIWDPMAEDYKVWEIDDWKDRWSILGSGTTVVDLKTVVDEDLSWEELQRRIVYELEKNEDRSWRGQRLWRNDGGKVAMVLEHKEI
ncbi:hypothetical protein SCUP515_10769 [Seiridium cupressi]